MAGQAGGGLDAQDMLGGEALAGLEPFPDRRLGYAADARESRLASGALDSLEQGFVGGQCICHDASYSE